MDRQDNLTELECDIWFKLVKNIVKTDQHIRVGALWSHHPGCDYTPVGPSKDTHGTRRPVRGKGVDGPATSHDTRRHLRTGTRHILSSICILCLCKTRTAQTVILISYTLIEAALSCVSRPKNSWIVACDQKHSNKENWCNTGANHFFLTKQKLRATPMLRKRWTILWCAKN